MKICAYVQNKYAKQTYKKESYNVRTFAGLSVVIDILERDGFNVEYAGNATVHQYDIVLVSMTSDCDWWSFINERVKWQKGKYKVIIGGQGVLNVRPFLEFADYFVLGRAEGIICKLVQAISKNTPFEHVSIIESNKFDIDKKYLINQVNELYQHEVKLQNGEIYREDIIGCNHQCLFCGYTWQRKNCNNAVFEYSGLWNGGADRERAIIDIDEGVEVNLNKLRTTAIDGMSERLRFAVNKKITREMLRNFIERLAKCDKPHQLKLYNIIGYPDENTDDWFELLEDIRIVDGKFLKTDKQTCLLLHSTPFRAMPATPMACKPMSYKNYRGMAGKVLGKGLKGNIFYQGNAIWAVEGMGTEGLSTVIQSAIVWRGVEIDSDNIIKISQSKKFLSSSGSVKQSTLEKYFDVAKLFGEFNKENLPTRYLKTYAKIEKMW